MQRAAARGLPEQLPVGASFLIAGSGACSSPLLLDNRLLHAWLGLDGHFEAVVPHPMRRNFRCNPLTLARGFLCPRQRETALLFVLCCSAANQLTINKFLMLRLPVQLLACNAPFVSCHPQTAMTLNPAVQISQDKQKTQI